MAETNYTATFNQNIEAPNFGEQNKYELNVILTTTGFGGELKYELNSGNNVTIKDNILLIDSGAFGLVSITVTDGKEKATAETEIYGFYAKIYENVEIIKKQYDISRKVYPELIPKSRDKVEAGSPKVPFKGAYKEYIDRLPK